MRTSCTVSSQCTVSGEVAHGVSIQQEPVYKWELLLSDVLLFCLVRCSLSCVAFSDCVAEFRFFQFWRVLMFVR